MTHNKDKKLKVPNNQPTHSRPTTNHRISKILVSIITFLAIALYSIWPQHTPESPASTADTQITATLTGDPQIDRTIVLIQQGGPFPYPHKDGSTFQNREKHLPQKPRGYYREYTVPTPGANDRGARRIVTGGNPPEIYYYTADHYRSFRKLDIAK